MRTSLLSSEQVLPTVTTWIVAALYGSGGVFPRMPEGVIAIGAIWYLCALFWGKILLASINETEWPGILAIVLFIVGVHQGHDLTPLKHSAGALRGAVYVCRAESAESRRVR